MSEIKKERDVIENKLANAIKDHTNAQNGKSGKLFSASGNKKQHDIDEKKALMDLWKVKLNTAVSYQIWNSLCFIVYTAIRIAN